MNVKKTSKSENSFIIFFQSIHQIFKNVSEKKKDLILIFLVSLYPFLSFLKDNSKIINFNEIYTSFFIFFVSFLIMAVIYILSSSLLRHINIKSHFLVVFICLASIAFFGFHDIVIFLKEYILPHTETSFGNLLLVFLKSHAIIIALLIVFVVFGVSFYFQSQIRQYLFYVFSLLTLFVLPLIIFNFLLSLHSNESVFHSNTNQTHRHNVIWDKNVYIIVADGYPRQDYIKKYLDYDNSNFLDFLRSKGFYIVEKSTSNYPITFLSLHSFLTSSYPYNEDSLSYNRWKSYKVLGGLNPAAEIFLEKGYNYIHVGSGAWEGSSCQNPKGRSYHKSKNLPLNLSYEVLTIFLNKTPFSGKFEFLADSVVTISDIEEYLKKEIKKKEKIFLFAHTLPPHAPFIFDAHCRKKSCDSMVTLGSTQSSRKEFLENLICTNRQIMSFVTFLEREDPNAIVVFLSDHGSDFSVNWKTFPEEWTQEAINERFSNFLAIKAPSSYQKQYLYPSLSLVNVLNFLFSCLNLSQPKYREDISYITVYEDVKPPKLFLKANQR
jgi:hypothetical protein